MLHRLAFLVACRSSKAGVILFFCSRHFLLSQPPLGIHILALRRPAEATHSHTEACITAYSCHFSAKRANCLHMFAYNIVARPLPLMKLMKQARPLKRGDTASSLARLKLSFAGQLLSQPVAFPEASNGLSLLAGSFACRCQRTCTQTCTRPFLKKLPEAN